jgi:hypothetical protein
MIRASESSSRPPCQNSFHRKAAWRRWQLNRRETHIEEYTILSALRSFTKSLPHPERKNAEPTASPRQENSHPSPGL